MSFLPSTSRAALRAPLTRSFSSSPASASQIGRAAIALPSSVTLSHPPTTLSGPSIPAGHRNNTILTVSGPLGAQTIPIKPFVQLAHTSDELRVTIADAAVKAQRAMWGLTRALIANAVVGVTEGYRLPLRLVGVGYRAAVEDDGAGGKRINLKVGKSHPVLIAIPEGIKVETPLPTRIVLSGVDKAAIGGFAAKIRAERKPEPYNGKGIFVGDETIKRKDVRKK